MKNVCRKKSLITYTNNVIPKDDESHTLQKMELRHPPIVSPQSVVFLEKFRISKKQKPFCITFSKEITSLKLFSKLLIPRFFT